MNENQFWEIIENANEKIDRKNIINYIILEISSGNDERIFCFHDILMTYFRCLQKNMIIAAAKIINPEHDDEWFDGFCAWIILSGEHVFKNVLLEPEYLIEVVVDSDSCTFYEIFSVATKAFFQKRNIKPDYKLFYEQQIISGLTSFQKEVIESKLDFSFNIDNEADDTDLSYIMPRLYDKFN